MDGTRSMEHLSHSVSPRVGVALKSLSYYRGDSPLLERPPPDGEPKGTGFLAGSFKHVHFHVVPRSPDLNLRLRGPRVFVHLGGDPACNMSVQVPDRLAIRVE
jgi:hypothetical protein